MGNSRQFEDFEPERLVKSAQRVRDLGEVFTPANIVDDMLDLLSDDMWQVHPSRTFLEPSVGSGNFVSAILSRKLTLLDEMFADGVLPAGKTSEAAEFHALEALSSIYGVDISEDNIIGGTPGHEVACRPRLLGIMEMWHSKVLHQELDSASQFLASAKWIVDHNMIIGNMLSKDSDGKSTNRESMPIFEYKWKPEGHQVELLATSLGDIMAEAEEGQSDVLSLFGPQPPELIWQGLYSDIFKAPSRAQVQLTGRRTSNSRGSK